MDDSHLIKRNEEYKRKREEKYKQDSKDRLAKILKKKIETTMIGALSSVEEHLGFLWESDSGKMTPDQRHVYELYQKIRSEILDRGNAQARNIDAELNQYEVNWLKYNLVLPVRNNKSQEQKKDNDE